MKTHTRCIAIFSGPVLLSLSACDAGGRANTPGFLPPPSGSQLQVDFGLRRDLHLGTAFLGDVLHVDLNGDGIEDLVETNFLPRRITLALGQPDGSFATLLDLATVGHPWRLAIGDFDGDLDIDLAVAEHEWQGSATPAVEVFLQGPSSAEFSTAAKTLLLSADPTDLAAAPITGKAGDPGPDELFVAVRDAQEVARLALDGSGDLVQTGAFTSSNLGQVGGPYSVALVDLGADLLLDVVVGEDEVPGASDRIVQYARTPSGFQPAGLVFSPVFKPIVDAVGDIDQNGYDDVAVAQQEGDEVLLLAADAAGLSSVVPIDFGGGTTSLIFPDLNGDGFAEAVGTTFLGSAVQVRLGTAPMTWDEPVYYSVGPVPRAIDTILLPGDSIPDLLCGNAQDLSLLLGLGGGSFRAARGFPLMLDASTVETADLDNDGDLDAVVISRFQQTIAFIEGFGDGTLEMRVVLPLTPTPDDEPGHLGLADMDQDGDLDVLTSVKASDELRLYRNGGSVASFTTPPPGDITPVGSLPLGIAVADFDGDTLPDVTVCNSGDNTLQVLRNAGNGELTTLAVESLPFSPEGIKCMDFDADVDLDAAVLGLDAGGNLLAIMEGDGTGVLGWNESHSLIGPSDSMAIGDLDEDGLPDLVVGQTDSDLNELFIFRSQVGLSFFPERLLIGDGPAAVVVADLDLDQNLDILVGTTPGELRLAFGNGQGGFPTIEPQTAGELPLPHYTLSISYADTNGDELPDLVIVSPYTPFIWVGLNTSVAVQPQ